jgi:hypothetical protein
MRRGGREASPPLAMTQPKLQAQSGGVDFFVPPSNTANVP